MFILDNYRFPCVEACGFIMVLSEMRMPDSGLIGIKLIRRGWREICVSIDTRILPDRAANCRMRTAD